MQYAVPPFIDLTRPQRGQVRIMTSAISYVRPRIPSGGHRGQAACVVLIDGNTVNVTEGYAHVCRLLEGQDPNEPTPVPE